MRKFASALVLGVSLLTPVATLQAQEHPQQTQGHPRHEWSASEDPPGVSICKNIKYHDWKRANKREQQDYWKWRDSHRDERR
jgi:hypothetical protein